MPYAKICLTCHCRGYQYRVDNGQLFSVDINVWIPPLPDIGHSYVTHSYLLKEEDQPQCVACNSPWTVMHDCVDFDLIRTDHLIETGQKNCLRKYKQIRFLAYLKENNLFARFYDYFIFYWFLSTASCFYSLTLVCYCFYLEICTFGPFSIRWDKSHRGYLKNQLIFLKTLVLYNVDQK